MMWLSKFRTRNSARQRFARARHVGPDAVLRVECLEVRSLLSAATPWPAPDFAPHWEDARTEEAAAWQQQADVHESFDFRDADAGTEEIGAPHFGRDDHLPLSASLPKDQGRGMLAAQAPRDYPTMVLYVFRFDAPSGISGHSMANESLGGDWSGEPTSTGGDARRLAATSPPPGARPNLDVAGGQSLAVNIDGDRSRTTSVPASWIESDAPTQRREEASPLLRALESRDAVFRALAGTSAPARARAEVFAADAKLASSIAAGKVAGKSHDGSGEEDGGAKGLTLREATEAQRRDVLDILALLASEGRGASVRPARRLEARPPAELVPTDGEVARVASPADGASVDGIGPIDVEADLGGMVLMRMPGTTDGNAAAIDEAFSATVDFDAPVAAYRAFAVAGRSSPAAMPAAEAPASDAREGNGKPARATSDGSGPSGAQLASVAVGATVLALHRRKSRSDDDPRLGAIPQR